MRDRMQRKRAAHRTASVACIASFVRLHPGSHIKVRLWSKLTYLFPDQHGRPDANLFACCIDSLVSCLSDESLTVRKVSYTYENELIVNKYITMQFALRGLGDVSHADAEQLPKYTSTALSAVMAGLEDPGDERDECALEAMQALAKLCTRVQQTDIDDILVSVLLRIRPCFEKVS